MNIDLASYKIISTYLISDLLTPIVKIITNLGGEFFLVGITIILLLLIKNRKVGFAICLNLVTSATVNFILKNIIQRPRPTGFRLIDVSGYSFPSGHSMVSMSFYGFLIYLSLKYIKNKPLKFFLAIILSILIICIGTSRIYLGVHYTTDVIGGFCVALLYLVIFIRLVNKNILEHDKK